MAKLTTHVEPAVAPTATTAGEAYRRLLVAGLTVREAATLVGRLNGLGQARGGWTIGEVEHLLFVQELYRTGRIRS